MAHQAPTRTRIKQEEKNDETKIDNINCRRRASAWWLRNRANANHSNANRANAENAKRATGWPGGRTRKSRTRGERSVRKTDREIEPHCRPKGKGAADLRSGQTGTDCHAPGHDAENQGDHGQGVDATPPAAHRRTAKDTRLPAAKGSGKGSGGKKGAERNAERDERITSD